MLGWSLGDARFIKAVKWFGIELQLRLLRVNMLMKKVTIINLTRIFVMS